MSKWLILLVLAVGCVQVPNKRPIPPLPPMPEYKPKPLDVLPPAAKYEPEATGKANGAPSARAKSSPEEGIPPGGVKRMCPFPTCNGDGRIWCATCYGTGSNYRETGLLDPLGNRIRETLPCLQCRGVTTLECPQCNGRGYFIENG
jgi:hypothetical protein